MSCKVVQKGGFGPPICSGWDTQILDMHFQIALTSEQVTGIGSVPFAASTESSWRRKKKEEERKKEREKEESVVNYKSADNYVGRPKNEFVDKSQKHNWSDAATHGWRH